MLKLKYYPFKVDIQFLVSQSSTLFIENINYYKK